MPKTISAVICCKNEEALIGRCLESVKNADEIIVLDSGSRDGTLDIVRKYTDKIVMDFIWTDDFSAMQNHAKKFATCDWIISVDSDEYVVNFDEVRKAVELGTDMVRVKMKAEGRGRLEFGFGRLFRNSPDIYWVQPIHKHLNIPGEGEEVGNVEIIFGWSPAHELDPNRTLRILESVVAAEGNNAGRNLYYLGREYWYKAFGEQRNEMLQKATSTLGRYVQISQWPAEKAEAFLIMSQAYSTQGLDEDAKDAILQCIWINPNFKEAIEWAANISTSAENAKQWRRMAKTANNRDVMWDRVPASPVSDIILLETHQDDFALFAAYTALRVKPLIVSITSSHIQFNRGDISCDENTRRKESIEAAKIAGCPIVFLDIPDTELTEEILKERLQHFNPETIYIPAYHENGNEQHNLVNKVALELFGRNKCEQYCSYVKGDFNIVKGSWEVKPIHNEVEIKNKMLDCYVSQLNLSSTRPHFEAVRNRSEWLI